MKHSVKTIDLKYFNGCYKFFSYSFMFCVQEKEKKKRVNLGGSDPYPSMHSSRVILSFCLQDLIKYSIIKRKVFV